MEVVAVGFLKAIGNSFTNKADYFPLNPRSCKSLIIVL